jgi:hypothetical protein
VVEYVPNELAVHQSIGTISSIWSIRVEPHAEGTTLTIEVEYNIPIPVLGKVAEQFAVRRDARTLEWALTNVEEMLAPEPVRNSHTS